MSTRGRFITLEGGEGAGKSTQAVLLADSLRALGQEVVRTREPGGTPGAEILRDLLLSARHDWAMPAEVLLHFAARAEHVARLIEPALAQGAWVICDRFADSTMVYQGHALCGNRNAIDALTAMLPVRPDLTVVLDVSVATTMRRLRDRGTAADRYERLGEGFFARVRQGFLDIAEASPERCVVLSGEGEFREVADTVLDTVRQRLGVPA